MTSNMGGKSSRRVELLGFGTGPSPLRSVQAKVGEKPRDNNGNDNNGNDNNGNGEVNGNENGQGALLD